MTDPHWVIYDLVARFDDAVNRRDPEEFRHLWTEDATWEIGEPRPLPSDLARADRFDVADDGRGDHVAVSGSFAGLVEIKDDGTAHGRWPCIETGVFKDGASYDNRSQYVDTYVNTADGWRIRSRRYEYLWLSTAPIAGQSFKVD